MAFPQERIDLRPLMPRTEIGKVSLYLLRGVSKFLDVRFLDRHAGQDVSTVVPRVNWVSS